MAEWRLVWLACAYWIMYRVVIKVHVARGFMAMEEIVVIMWNMFLLWNQIVHQRTERLGRVCEFSVLD